jgi:hypothetical protein
MNMQLFALPILLVAYFTLGLAYSIVIPKAAEGVSHFAYSDCCIAGNLPYFIKLLSFA